MSVLGSFLDSRDAEPSFPPLGRPAEERLEKFDRWLRFQLGKRIDWTWAGDETAQGRRKEQARNYVERMVLALWRRGWLMDGASLGRHIIAPLDAIADYQKRGTIKEFWPYFCATIDRYVGVNSEEIQVEAKRIGATLGNLLADMVKTGPSLTELLARRAEEQADAQISLRERQSAYRAKERAKRESEDNQLPLL